MEKDEMVATMNAELRMQGISARVAVVDGPRPAIAWRKDAEDDAGLWTVWIPGMMAELEDRTFVCICNLVAKMIRDPSFSPGDGSEGRRRYRDLQQNGWSDERIRRMAVDALGALKDLGRFEPDEDVYRSAYAAGVVMMLQTGGLRAGMCGWSDMRDRLWPAVASPLLGYVVLWRGLKAADAPSDVIDYVCGCAAVMMDRWKRLSDGREPGPLAADIDRLATRCGIDCAKAREWLTDHGLQAYPSDITKR